MINVLSIDLTPTSPDPYISCN